jgi:hypothetical protein
MNSGPQKGIVLTIVLPKSLFRGRRVHARDVSNLVLQVCDMDNLTASHNGLYQGANFKG